MAYSGICTKKRIYHAVPRSKPTAEQWKSFVELPGCEGGLRATTLPTPPWLHRAVHAEPVSSKDSTYNTTQDFADEIRNDPVEGNLTAEERLTLSELTPGGLIFVNGAERRSSGVTLHFSRKHVDEAMDDLREIRDAIRASARRRFAPPWALPTEIWILIL